MGEMVIFLLMLFSSNIVGGYVCDKETGEYLSGVRIVSSNDTLYTDLNGQFFLSDVKDSVIAKFELISYEPVDTVVVLN